MSTYIYLILSSLASCFLFAFARSFQSNSLWLFLGFLVYLGVGFLWNRSKVFHYHKLLILSIPILADATFMQVIAIRPSLIIVSIFAFLGLLMGLYFRKAFIYAFGLVSLVFANIFSAFYFFPSLEFEGKTQIGNRLLPNAVFVNAYADSLATKDLNGKIVLIDMWYAKCGACFAQFAETEKIYQHFKSNPKVLVMGLNTGIDELDMFLAANKLIRQKKNLQFPLWLDTEMLVSKNLHMQEFPQSIIVDSKGQIRYIHKGFSRDEENIYSRKMINIIEALLYEEK